MTIISELTTAADAITTSGNAAAANAANTNAVKAALENLVSGAAITAELPANANITQITDSSTLSAGIKAIYALPDILAQDPDNDQTTFADKLEQFAAALDNLTA